ncbi:hypothetical protein U3516DRAFT_590217 [Neocallimastix sp. 'constans']
MDFNDIFKFDEIANDNDINSNNLDENYKKKIILDNSLINTNENKIIENADNKLIPQQKEQYDFDNTNNMILDIPDIPINSVMDSLSKVPFENSISSNSLLDTTDKKVQDIFNTEDLKNTESNTLYPQLYPTEMFTVEEEQDAFTQYMGYPNVNMDMNNNPYFLYYNNAFIQDEVLPQYNMNDYLNYNSEFDLNGINPYCSFPSDFDIEDIDMENYSLAASSQAPNDPYKQALSLAQGNVLKDDLLISDINKNTIFEDKKQKNLGSLNTLNSSPLTPLSINKSSTNSFPKLSLNSDSFIIPSNEESETMIEDSFKYIYPMNPKSKLLSDLKNNMNFENMLPLETMSQQMNISDNIMKKSILDEKLNPLENIEDLNLNTSNFSQELNNDVNNIYPTLLNKLKSQSQSQIHLQPNSQIVSSKINTLNNMKNINDLMDFNFSSLENTADENLIKIDSPSINNKNITNSSLIPDDLSSLLFTATEHVSEQISRPVHEVSETNNNLQNSSALASVDEYKSIVNSFEPQDKDYSESLLKMFIASPKLSNSPKSSSKEPKATKDQLMEDDLSTKILTDKIFVSSPTMSEFINEPKEQIKELPPSSNMSKLPLSSLTKSSSIKTEQNKNVNKLKLPNSKSHSLLNNIMHSPIQKKTSSLTTSKSKDNIFSKKLSKKSINDILPSSLYSSISSNNTSTSINSPVSSPSLMKSLAQTAAPTSLLTKTNTHSTLSTLPKLLPIIPATSTISESLIKSKSITQKSIKSEIPISSASLPTSSSSSVSSQSKKSTTKPLIPLIPTPILATKPSPKTVSSILPLSTKKLLPSLNKTIVSSKTSNSTTKAKPLASTISISSITTSSTTVAKIVPKPIAPLASLPLPTTIPSLTISTALHNKPNLSVPPILPSTLFPFLFADSSNLKSVAENLAKSTLPITSTSNINITSIPSSTTPSSSLSTTVTNASPIPITTTISQKINATTTPTGTNNISSGLVSLSSLSLSNPAPIATPILPATLKDVKSTSTTIPIKKEMDKPENINNKKASSPASTSSLTPTTNIIKTMTSTLSTPATATNSTDSKTNKNVSKNNNSSNNYIDEKRRKFLERNRIAASKCRQKKKAWVQDLEKKSNEVSITNRNLKLIVNQLRDQVAVLRGQLLLHKNCQSKVLQQYLLQQSSINLSLQNTLQSLNQNTIGNPSLLNFKKIQ